MNMDAARMLAIHERITVRLKKLAVKAARGPHDVNPSLYVTLADGTHYAGAPINSKMGPDFDLGRAVAMDVFLLWVDRQQNVERIIVCTDSYVQMVEDRDEAEAIMRGDLGHDFRTNPSSRVTESSVTAFIWHDDGRYRAAMCSQSYALREGGVIIWEEPNMSDVVDLDDDDTGFGAVLDAAHAVMRITREDTPT